MKALVFVMLWGAVAVTQASGVPTIDIANIVQTTKNAFENIEQTRSLIEQEAQGVRQLADNVQQLKYQFEQIENMNGNYLKHMFLNDAKYRRARRLIPRTYQGMRELSTDSQAMLDRAGISRGGIERIKDAMVAVKAGDTEIARADELISESEELIKEINNNTEMKAALDLANRNAGQNQMILAEILRLQGVLLAQKGRQQLNTEIQKAADNSKASFTGFSRLQEK